MTFIEHTIERPGGSIYAREYPGANPAIVLLHGFPDNMHLYDRLVPQLQTSGRRVITFDFLGWGQSDKPDDYPYSHDSLTADLDAVIKVLALEQVTLVAHDASGPPAIDWSLDHPARIAGLVLLNTYYHATPSLRAPEAIFGFSRPLLGKAFQWLMERGDLYSRLYRYQVGHFMRDKAAREHFVPLLYQQMDGPAARTTRKAFYALNDDLIWTNIDRLRRLPEVKTFQRPVSIIFGAGDQYLNAGVARDFHRLFPNSQLHLLPNGRHFVQIDEPEAVARHILSMPAPTPVYTYRVTIAPHAVAIDAPWLFRLMYLLFTIVNIVGLPVILIDRLFIWLRVQRTCRQDNARYQAEPSVEDEAWERYQA